MTNLIVDTNVLVRAAIDDDQVQTRRARAVMRDAERLVIATTTLCEYVWVVSRVYRLPKADILRSIRLLVAGSNVSVDIAAVEAGLSFMEAGGDFADGVIAFEGRRLGGDIFATFDRRAAALTEKAGRSAWLLSAD